MWLIPAGTAGTFSKVASYECIQCPDERFSSEGADICSMCPTGMC